jgi:3,4-dihydroxy-2-butanone 4-phosphate synthase
MALLRAADGLLDQRKGQTELSIAMAQMADVTPAVTICEMLDDESGAPEKGYYRARLRLCKVYPEGRS